MAPIRSGIRPWARWGVALTAALTLAACGGSDDGGASDGASGADDSGASSESGSSGDPAAGLPSQCVLAPFTAVVEESAPVNAGSASFGVVDAVALPIPITPTDGKTVSLEESRVLAAETDLLGYSLVVADEDIKDGSVTLFGGYEPETPGASRAFVSIFPSSTTPIAQGDTIVPGAPSTLGLTTTLSSIGMDLKTSGDDFSAYVDQAVGSVTVVALTDAALCLDVDLQWTTSDDSTLTIKGIFAAPLLPRATFGLS